MAEKKAPPVPQAPIVINIHIENADALVEAIKRIVYPIIRTPNQNTELKNAPTLFKKEMPTVLHGAPKDTEPLPNVDLPKTVTADNIDQFTEVLTQDSILEAEDEDLYANPDEEMPK